MLVPLVPNSPAPVMLTGSPLEPRVRGPCESVLPAQCLGRGVGTDVRERATPDAAASWSAYACEAQPAGISFMCRPCSSRQPADAYSPHTLRRYTSCFFCEPLLQLAWPCSGVLYRHGSGVKRL